MHGGRGRGHGGSAPSSQGQMDGRLRAMGTDRFCTNCGGLIKGLATSLLAFCPHVNCGAPIPLVLQMGGTEFDVSGWGRCRNCKSFIFQHHLYCQCCRQVNLVAKAAKDLQQKQQLAKRQHELMKENEAKETKIARQSDKIRELHEKLARQEIQLMAQSAEQDKDREQNEDLPPLKIQALNEPFNQNQDEDPFEDSSIEKEMSQTVTDAPNPGAILGKSSTSAIEN